MSPWEPPPRERSPSNPGRDTKPPPRATISPRAASDAAGARRQEAATSPFRPDLLIIDDMGMKQLPKRSGEYLFEIFMRRHQTRSTIMTSNRPLEDWGKILGDVPSASAILDRFLHHAEIITFQGRSYRLRNRLADDAGPVSQPRTDSKPANAPTGNQRAKAAKAAAATTVQTATT